MGWVCLLPLQSLNETLEELFSTLTWKYLSRSLCLYFSVEPKVYVSAGSSALIDGGNETTVATCIAERGRPPADVSWETDLYGTSEAHMQDDANGTTTTQVHYTWRPSRHAQGNILTCVVKHPALQNDFRIPYTVNVQCEYFMHTWHKTYILL